MSGAVGAGGAASGDAASGDALAVAATGSALPPTQPVPDSSPAVPTALSTATTISDDGLTVGVAGVGVLGPGLSGWDASASVLRAPPAGWQAQPPTLVPVPERLPATERRRAGAVVRASIAVADAALLDARTRAGVDVDAAALPTVFTSSTGDPLNCHLLCEALAATERLLSPTRFTNSVHNAAAGYWHIAALSRAPSTSLAAFDASFAAGLLEAAVQCRAHGTPVLLVACDVPYPQPLHALRPVADVFAVALLLVPPGQGGRALTLDLHGIDTAAAVPTVADGEALEALRRAVPAARALPLLQALARDAAAAIVVDGAPASHLALRVAAAVAASGSRDRLPASPS